MLVYKNEFHRRNYSIMQERDMNGTSFDKIGEIFKLKSTSVRRIYNDTKRKQIGLYAMAICKSTEISEHELLRYLYWLTDELKSFACVVAFLEKRYEQILNEFRDGEPAMSDKIIKKLVMPDSISETVPDGVEPTPVIFLC